MRFSHSRCSQRNPTPDTVPTPFSVPSPARPGISSVQCRTRTSSRRGFALLITITLLAFLVLLLVSLASLTRVETQVAANNTQLSQARANALFALNLAVGQLQKYAGPDQAVTARADIDAANTGNPFWTGVWDAAPRDSAGVALAVPTHAGAPAANAPLAWLVNGNESAGTTLTPAMSAVAAPASGNDNVWLLRKIMGADISDTGVYSADMGVRLSKSLIRVAPALVPGMGATGSDVTTGAYAWWVGDEGVKAKVNLADPYRTAASASVEAAYRREAASKPDPSLFTGSSYQTAFGSPTAAFETMREDLLSFEQLPLLHADLSTPDGLRQTGGYFHDLTTAGQGVLADTMRGGLRRDLTRGLTVAPASGSVAAGEVADGTAVFAAPTPGPYGRTARGPSSALWTAGNEPRVPSWDQVRGWFDVRAPADGTSMAPVSAPLTGGGSGTLPSVNGHALMPIPAVVQIGYGVDIVDSKLRLMLRPRVVLVNPYNVPLARADYTVCYVPSVQNATDWRVLVRLDRVAPSGVFASAPIALVNYLPARCLAFNINDAFAPGEVRVYSLGATADNTFTRGLVTLEPGLTTANAYAENQAGAPPSETWFSDPNNVRASIESMPRDHPRITISLGATTGNADGSVNVPSESLHARYIQTEAAYVNPQTPSQRPRGIVGTGEAKMLRMIRLSLRHGALDRISNGNHQASESYVGATTPADSTSGVRMLIDMNPRAVLSQMVGGWRSVAQYGVTVANKGTADEELDFDNLNAFWGGNAEDDGYGSSHAILFDVLRENEEVVSLGRLGQVNWGVDGKHPAYPLGNSFASIFYAHNAPDYGYALNEAMWDRFFLSTLPVSLATRPANLPNARLRFHDAAGASASLTPLEGMDAYQLAAKRLMVDGAFNINSTSVEAWAAFLGSVQAADYAYRDRAGSRTETGVRPFPRLGNLHDPDPSATGQSGNLYEWTGYRPLDGAQLKSIAARIVAGIKARGRPARSLAEFMNRDLSQPATSVRNQMGIVQAAIDSVVNTADPATTGGGRDGLAALPGLDPVRVVAAGLVNADNPDAARGKLRTAGAPGFLLQSDLLTPLAPAMSARSDTFRVRTYGETRNPVTGEVGGRAWCEAIVQRTPDFVGGEAAELRLNDAALGAISKAFGRKFVITQFRWLGPDEI